MSIKALELLEAIRWRLDDFGGDTGAVPSGHYSFWQSDDRGCLWKNRELVWYLNQTIRDLNQRAPWLDSEYRIIPLALSVRTYEMDGDIVRVADVWRASDGNPLVKTTTKELDHVTRWHRNQRQDLVTDWRKETGNPTHYFLDEQRNSLSVYPLPTTDHVDTLNLSVWVGYPAAPTWETLSAEATPTAVLPGIADDLDEALIAGVCARAYRKHDADAHNAELARQHSEEFTAAVGPALSQRQLDVEARWIDQAIPVEASTFYAR